MSSRDEDSILDQKDQKISIKDFKGNKFDLNQFIDPKTAFITEKTKEGQPDISLKISEIVAKEGQPF